MPAVPLCMQFVPTYTADTGETAANVMHFIDIGGDFDQATVDGILEAWSVFWAPLSNEGWNLDDTALFRDLSVDPSTDLVAAFESENGQGSGDHLPANCAWVLSLIAGSGGRRGRGRVYVPGLGDSDAGGSLLGPGFITAALTGFTTYATTCAVDFGWVPAVYSRTDGIARVVASGSVDNVVDSQRRRSQRLAS